MAGVPSRKEEKKSGEGEPSERRAARSSCRPGTGWRTAASAGGKKRKTVVLLKTSLPGLAAIFPNDQNHEDFLAGRQGHFLLTPKTAGGEIRLGELPERDRGCWGIPFLDGVNYAHL